MLVLTRKLQETIKIGDQVTIHVLRVKGNTVRLGIDAPRQIRVVRGELVAQEKTTAGRPVRPRLPAGPAHAPETAPVDSRIEGPPSGSGPALSGFFPRVLRTVQFPPLSMDPNRDSIGS